MGYWHEPPYHGDGKSNDIKPRRRLINIKRNRREIIKSIFIIVIILFVPFGSIFIFGQSPYGNDITLTGSAVIGLIFLLILIAGIVSISRFRKGIDIEIPDEIEDQKDKSSKEHKKHKKHHYQ
jgi:Na+-transporting methylmalonyl-CoA/oxaloacetate decarboxylase gamma subunit